jgi:arylsulfatase A-like enzyme
MKNQVTRRDFLKLAGLLPLSLAAPNFVSSSSPKQQSGKSPNVIIVVFDAFTANNISLYGYQRATTPNLARLAERAIVYHNHHAGGNFTAPGTATLLTGTLPWTHRAFNHAGKVEAAFVNENIFTAFDAYYRLAYSHNPMANNFLVQFKNSIDNYVPREKLFLNSDTLVPSLFANDDDIATVSWLRAIKGAAEDAEQGYAYSLFLSPVLHAYEKFQDRKIEALQAQFPLGLPSVFTDNYYLLEDAVNWFESTLSNLPKPFISYLHFMPPHAPYRTRREFYGRLKDDGWLPQPKAYDLFSREADQNAERTYKKRTSYDEFILYVDSEFGRFFDHLENSGLLEDTWLILTADHGEMFERGIIGHTTPVLYEPVIHIPLMIFEPGKRTHTDVHVTTSAIDILPTLLHITGQQTADWAEGVVLPPFSDSYPDVSRNIYALEARKNRKHAPLSIATTTLIKGRYKLMYFFGYEELGKGGERIELYDIENDPEETNDLFQTKKETAGELFNELKLKLAEVNKPYL